MCDYMLRNMQINIIDIIGSSEHYQYFIKTITS